MITGTTSRQQRGTASRRVLAVLVVFWLNLVAAPCGMAFDGEHSCAHCPPAQDHQAAGHHGDTARSDCDTLNSGCDERSAASVDARLSLSKLKDGTQPVMIVAAPWSDPIPAPAGFALATVMPPGPVAAPPPTYLLNCVFRK